MIKSLLTALYYYPLKLYVTITGLFYFRKIMVKGHKNIPKKGPIIYAITHQNSLLDAYLANAFSWRTPYFMVRADIYKHKFIDKVLRSIKTLPIYRIRDGYDSIKKNDQSFDATKEILKKGGAVAIFPEGSHSMTHRLRPLKKGIARITFMAEAAEDFNLNVQIVPIGINYESYLSTSGRTLITYGKPISIVEYKQTFLDDPNKAYRALILELSLRMKSLIVHIGSPDYDRVHEKYIKQRVFKKNLFAQLKSDQALIECIEQGDDFNDIADKIPALIQFINNTLQTLRVFIGYIPKKIVQFIVKRMIKDKNFIATISFTFSMFIYPLFYTLLYYLVKIAMIYFK